MISEFVKKTSYIAYKQGQPNGMYIAERQIKCGQNEVLMKVKSIGLNRAQCLQRNGKYPAHKQIQKFLGLQASGQIYDPNSNKPQQKIFDGIALLSGGSYAQWAVVPKSFVMRMPSGLTYQQGAAIPQAWLTAFQLIRFANLSQGQSLVAYAGASGVGTAIIQLCNHLKLNAFAVCSTAEKGKICLEIGAKGIAYYKDNQSWADQLLKQNNGKGFQAVLDCVGSSNVSQTLKLLGLDGRWILYGLLSGPKTDLNLGILLSKRINLISTTLKSRTDQYKEQLIKDFQKKALQGFQNGSLKPIIHSVIKCDWKSEKAFVQGHLLMQSNQNAGKIIIDYQ